MTDGQSPKVPLELFSMSSLQRAEVDFWWKDFVFDSMSSLPFFASFEYHNLLCVGTFSYYLYTIKGSSKKLLLLGMIPK